MATLTGCAHTGARDHAVSASTRAASVAVGSTADDPPTAALPAPRPVSPPSGATLTGHRPTFAWRLAPGTDGARIEVCRDRACRRIEASLAVTGTATVLANELEPGVWYWRVRGRDGRTIGQNASATWEFALGAANTPVSTAVPPVLDVDGDGYADLAVGEPQSGHPGRTHVYPGTSSGPPAAPVAALEGAGESSSCAGDVDGDGYADLVIGGARSSAPRVFFGSARGLAVREPTLIHGPERAAGVFGASVAGAGDVDGDGYADVLLGHVGALGRLIDPGHAYLYRGGPDGLSATPAVVITGPDGPDGAFGADVAGAGDVNGDGFADVLIGARLASHGEGRAYLYLGSEQGISSAPSASLGEGQGAGSNCARVASAGDVNADGYADVLVGCVRWQTGTGRVLVYLGGPSGLHAEPDATLDGTDGPGAEFAHALAAAGDVNGDGYADVVVSAWAARHVAGRAYVFAGGPGGIVSTPLATLDGPDGSDGYFGASVAGAGDVNNDGYADVVVGGSGAFAGKDHAFVYFGAAGTLGGEPSARLDPPANSPGQFGRSVAARSPATP